MISQKMTYPEYEIEIQISQLIHEILSIEDELGPRI